MNKLWTLAIVAFVALACASDVEAQQVAARTEPLRCGPCDIGYAWGSQCILPGLDVDEDAGLPAADTGARDVFDPDSYTGTDESKLAQAVAAAAAAPGGAVVMDRVYEIDLTITLQSDIMITGGGIRRKCSPVATITAPVLATDTCITVDDTTGFETPRGVQVATDDTYEGSGSSAPWWFGLTSKTSTTLCASGALGFTADPGDVAFVRQTYLVGSGSVSGVVIDSVLFDGAARCNSETHSWVYMNGVVLKNGNGTDTANTVRNSVFYDHPSEAITHCGTILEDNRAYRLYGSFAHASCAETDDPLSIYRRNLIVDSNKATNAVSGHAEGVFTFSANAGNIVAHDNKIVGGLEGAWGKPASDDLPVYAHGECYANVAHAVSTPVDFDKADFHFTGRLEGVPRFWEDDP